MGGLVAREYIRRYGSQNVDTLITIGTPNHGIYSYINSLCQVGHSGPECEDMQSNSAFLRQLNNDETPGDTKYITIAGDCCLDTENKPWDETVRVESVALNDATNIMIKGEGIPGIGTFHGELVKPSKVPEVYGKIINFLSQSNG